MPGRPLYSFARAALSIARSAAAAAAAVLLSIGEHDYSTAPSTQSTQTRTRRRHRARFDTRPTSACTARTHKTRSHTRLNAITREACANWLDQRFAKYYIPCPPRERTNARTHLHTHTTRTIDIKSRDTSKHATRAFIGGRRGCVVCCGQFYQLRTIATVSQKHAVRLSRQQNTYGVRKSIVSILWSRYEDSAQLAQL